MSVVVHKITAVLPETTVLELALMSICGLLMVIISSAVFVPPGPVHSTRYVEEGADGVTITLPLVAPPVLNPVPVQLVAPPELQTILVDSPSTTGLSSAVSVTVGGPSGGFTVTCTLALSSGPPLPEQVRVYVVVTLGETTSEPFV